MSYCFSVSSHMSKGFSMFLSERAFLVVGPSIWNGLSLTLCSLCRTFLKHFSLNLRWFYLVRLGLGAMFPLSCARVCVRTQVVRQVHTRKLGAPINVFPKMVFFHIFHTCHSKF